MSPAWSIAVRQLALPLRVRGRVACAFGETGNDWPGPHHCHACAAAVDDAVEWMRQARLRGEYNAQGYTPAEWKAKLKRERA